MMWFALVLPLLVLPALVGFSRFEQRVLRAPGAPAAPGSAAEPVRVGHPAGAPRP